MVPQPQSQPLRVNLRSVHMQRLDASEFVREESQSQVLLVCRQRARLLS